METKTELIKEPARVKLTDEEKKEAIRKLNALKGSLKGQARMSDEEARNLAAREIAEKFGIKLD
jgi:hypothetical protein